MHSRVRATPQSAVGYDWEYDTALVAGGVLSLCSMAAQETVHVWCWTNEKRLIGLGAEMSLPSHTCTNAEQTICCRSGADRAKGKHWMVSSWVAQPAPRVSLMLEKVV